MPTFNIYSLGHFTDPTRFHTVESLNQPPNIATNTPITFTEPTDHQILGVYTFIEHAKVAAEEHHGGYMIWEEDQRGRHLAELDGETYLVA